MPLTIAVESHPLLEVGAFVIRSAALVSELATPAAIARLAEPGAEAPLTATESTKAAVRDLLRAGGYKPSGRSKPASEYLAAAYAKQAFPRINALVDACNVGKSSRCPVLTRPRPGGELPGYHEEPRAPRASSLA